MITVELDNFSLREICRSGQCFRMHETAENNTYELVAGDKYLKISQAGSIVNFYCSDVEFICYWVPYFDIDSDYGRYIEKVNPRDTYLSAAVQCGNGIRILRQDLSEMIITFLISQQNNISRIVTNNEIVPELNMSVSTFGSAKNVLENDFHIILREIEQVTLTNGEKRNIGQRLGVPAEWSE